MESISLALSRQKYGNLRWRTCQTQSYRIGEIWVDCCLGRRWCVIFFLIYWDRLYFIDREMAALHLCEMEEMGPWIKYRSQYGWYDHTTSNNTRVLLNHMWPNLLAQKVPPTKYWHRKVGYKILVEAVQPICFCNECGRCLVGIIGHQNYGRYPSSLIKLSGWGDDR